MNEALTTPGGSRDSDDLAFLCHLYAIAEGSSFVVLRASDDGEPGVPAGTLFAAARRLEDRGYLTIEGQKIGELLLRVTHLGVLFVEENLAEIVGMDEVRARQSRRWEFLHSLYEQTIGRDASHAVSTTIGTMLGFSPDEANRIVMYWEDHGTVEIIAGSGMELVVRLTTEGVDSIEARLAPDVPVVSGPTSGSADDVLPDSGPASREVRWENTFRKEGHKWTVAFAGVTGHYDDRLGMSYIHHLITLKGERIHALELERVAGRVGRVETSLSPKPTADVSADDLLEKGHGLGVGEIMDDKYRKGVLKELEVKKEALKEAERVGHTNKATELRREAARLHRLLSEATDHKGRPRKALDPSDRSRKAVSAAVRRALDGMRSHQPQLVAHLRMSLQLGHFCSYRPPSPMDWTL